MTNKPTIELLYFDGCPNHEGAMELIRDTLRDLNLDAEVKEVKVTDNDDAILKRFLGSPSIRIDDKDLEIEEDNNTEYSMRCRIYRSDSGHTGLPSKELLRSALLAAAGRK